MRTLEAVLQKPARLNPEEYEIVKEHPAAILGTLLTPALDVVSSHHERWDGAGYPLGLAGDTIPLLARIFAVVDSLDAMTHVRPWRPALPVAEALESIREEAGKQFDPRVVDAALTIGEAGWSPLLVVASGAVVRGPAVNSSG